MRVERNGSTNYVTIHPSEGEHSATVIILHGLGDSADGFAGVAESWAQQLPHIKYVLPTAPTRKITLNGGMPMNAWYDIAGMTPAEVKKNCEGMSDSVEVIREIIAAEMAGGIPGNRIMVAGFSQGGALSLHTGLQQSVENKLAGIVVLSGYLAGSDNFTISPGLETTPVLHCHGEADPLVTVDMAHHSHQFCREKGMDKYELHTVPGMQHEVQPSVLQKVFAFMQSHVPFDTAYNIPMREPTDMSIKQLKLALQEAGASWSAKTRGFCEKREYIELLVQYRASKEPC